MTQKTNHEASRFRGGTAAPLVLAILSVVLVYALFFNPAYSLATAAAAIALGAGQNRKSPSFRSKLAISIALLPWIYYAVSLFLAHNAPD